MSDFVLVSIAIGTGILGVLLVVGGTFYYLSGRKRDETLEPREGIKRVGLAWKWVFLGIGGAMILLLVGLFILGAIQSLSTIVPIKLLDMSASTPVPLADRDLSMIALRQSDLPSVFANSDPSLSDLEGRFEQDLEVHNKVIDSYGVFYLAASTPHSLDNLVVVYEDEAQAMKAFQAMASSMSGTTSTEELEIPQVGTESRGVCGTSFVPDLGVTIHHTQILWRYEEAVAFVTILGPSRPSVSQMVQLAQLVQTRLESES